MTRYPQMYPQIGKRLTLNDSVISHSLQGKMNLVADIQIKCNLCPEVYNGQLGFGGNHAATRGSGTSTTQGNITSANDILSPYSYQSLSDCTPSAPMEQI